MYVSRSQLEVPVSSVCFPMPSLGICISPIPDSVTPYVPHFTRGRTASCDMTGDIIAARVGVEMLELGFTLARAGL